MSNLKKAAEMALEALNEVTGWQWSGPIRVMDEVEDAIQALRQALAQPEQEPVAWMCEGDDWGAWVPVVFLGNDLEYHKKSTGFRNWKPLYTTPPKREWVGLTDEDCAECVQVTAASGSAMQLIAAIEAKLKEKNT